MIPVRSLLRRDDNLKVENYFDNAATTPVDPRVIREMLPYFETHWGNANSLHAWGREAFEAVEFARARVAELIGAEDPAQVFFTSGATESNNWVLKSFDDVVVSPFEHSAVLEAPDGYRLIENDALKLLPLKWGAEIVSVMSVNNEIGSILSNPGCPTDDVEHSHSDITQSVGKLPVRLRNVSYASFSAHKFYGPKGVGGLYVDYPENSHLKTLIGGGGQQSGKRGGTLNVPGIVGMGAAAAIAQDEMDDNLALATNLRAAVLEQIRPCQDYQVNGGDNVSPYILSLSFLGVEGETLVIEMDQKGYGISAGAACSSGSTDLSHVLTALGLPIEWIRGTVRISFGKFNTLSAAEQLGKSMRAAVESLRKLRTI
jgi:cysteine desulfurase